MSKKIYVLKLDWGRWEPISFTCGAFSTKKKALQVKKQLYFKYLNEGFVYTGDSFLKEFTEDIDKKNINIYIETLTIDESFEEKYKKFVIEEIID
jgi:hypothetical protein